MTAALPDLREIEISAEIMAQIPVQGGTDDDDVQMFGSVKLAHLLLPRLLGRYRWCRELGWVHFTGSKWQTDAEPAALIEVIRTIKAYTQELLDVSPAGLTREACAELAGFSSGSTQNQALKIARGFDGIQARWDEFDPMPSHGAPWLVPCANGWTVELFPTGRISVRRTMPADMNTHTVCDYDATATAPMIGAAFEEYQPDEDVRRFMLQQWARGLSGMGSETFTVNLGEKGGNGKTTMQELLIEVSRDYSVELPVELILKGRGDAQQTYRSELAQMRGARLVFCDEPDEGDRYNQRMLKKITGGGELQGRGMGKEAITFKPRVLFSMAANNRPSWTADGGLDRRYIEISWDFTVEKSAIRESFKEELKLEASGFLNEILRHWQGSATLVIPDAVVQQTKTGRDAASPAARFVVEALVAEDGATVSGVNMYAAFVEWNKQNGIRPVSSTKFGTEMARLGLEKTRSANGMVYKGNRIVQEYQGKY